MNDLLDRQLLWRFQLSISTPQPGTPFYNRMKQKGYLRNVDWKHFDGGNHCVVDNPEYPAEMVMKNFREAEKLYEKGFDNRYTSTAKDNFQSIEINSTREILLFRTARMNFCIGTKYCDQGTEI